MDRSMNKVIFKLIIVMRFRLRNLIILSVTIARSWVPHVLRLRISSSIRFRKNRGRDM